MTVPSNKTKEIYDGNDVTTVFPYPFKIFASTHLQVILTDANDAETTLTEGIDYTVSGVGDAAGGNVTYPITGDPLATGEKLTVYRVPINIQSTDFNNQGGFFADTHENAFDLLTMITQYLQELVQRALTIPVSDDSGADPTLPIAEASKLIGWDSTGLFMVNYAPGSVTLATPGSDTIIASMINAAGTQATLDKLLSGNTAKWQKGADVASAAALPLLTDGNYNDVTGVAAITSINTVGIGTWRLLQFDGVLTLTHHATDLILPGGANITTAAGDHALMFEYASGDWICVGYFRANGLPVAFKDEDDMASDSELHVPSQQSVKKYVDDRVAGSNWPSFSVYRGAVQSINDTTNTKVQWTTKEFDTNSDFDNVTNYRFTPTVAGKYLLTACLQMTLNDAKSLRVRITKNGSLRTSAYSHSGHAVDGVSANVTCIETANGSTDYFEVEVYHTNGVATDLNGARQTTFFMGSRIA